ncbi:hypothetical protein HYU09_00470 [Candidatus Woesearchaeota archaeon]|nr:hypothetical protein [Candidatus Woesearchaeota archaeon]
MNIAQWWNQGRESDDARLAGDSWLAQIVNDHIRNRLSLKHDATQGILPNLFTIPEAIMSGPTAAARRYGPMVIPFTLAASYITTSSLIEYLK